MSFTYLIPHAASEELLKVCLDAINKHTPGSHIVCPKEQTGSWGESFRWLFQACPTDIGVFIDDDCVLLDDISDLITRVESGETPLIAVDGKNLGRGEGYFQSNLMIINIKKFLDEFGINGIDCDPELFKRETGKDSFEFMYGISQKLRDRNPVGIEARSGKYPYSSLFHISSRNIAVHLWYGAWRHRGDLWGDFQAREDGFIKDYYNNELKI